MKKFFKNIFIILFNIIIIFILIEILCYSKFIFSKVKDYDGSIIKTIKYNKYQFFKYKNFDDLYQYIKTKRLRQPIGLKYKEKPILLMGCSFAYGYGLQDNESLGYKLSEILKRPLYNRAFEWLWGLQTMLYQSRRSDFYKEVPPPEYVIYVYIFDHINRISASVIAPDYNIPHLRYIYKNNKLQREKFHSRYNLYMFRTYSILRAKSIAEKMDYKLINEYFIETKKEFDKHWKNYKFIILIYDEGPYSREKINIEELNKQGFIVIGTKDLTGRYLDQPQDKIEDKFHPSEYAWSLVAPKLADKLKELEQNN